MELKLFYNVNQKNKKTDCFVFYTYLRRDRESVDSFHYTDAYF